jgi:DNA-binding NarL/FixJ family response regulator
MTSATAPPTAESTWFEKRNRQRALYPRQREALQLYAWGKKYGEIAEAMGLAIGTARSYVGAAVVALGADNPTHAVQVAIERGEIEAADSVG